MIFLLIQIYPSIRPTLYRYVKNEENVVKHVKIGFNETKISILEKFPSHRKL